MTSTIQQGGGYRKWSRYVGVGTGCVPMRWENAHKLMPRIGRIVFNSLMHDQPSVEPEMEIPKLK